MYSGKQYRSLCFHLEVFFKKVLKFRLLDHGRTHPTAGGPDTFISYCICFHCGWKRSSFMFGRVDFTCWYVPWSLWPEAGWFILPVMMAYLWLLNHAKKKKKLFLLFLTYFLHAWHYHWIALTVLVNLHIQEACLVSAVK